MAVPERPTVHVPWRDVPIHLAAVAALTFYAVAAVHTVGHKADFARQWLGARMVVTGQGRHLYDTDRQRAELEKHFDPETIERLWLDRIGILTYPPVQAVLFSPLGLLPPRIAQYAVVELSLVAVVVTAILIARLTKARISWAAAVLAVCTLGPFLFAVGLGQNTAFLLVALAGGWWWLATGRPVWGGAVWGVLAFKPTWALAVTWVPAVVGRPRAYLGLIVTGAILLAATIPVCGVSSWVDWIDVASGVEAGYGTVPKWQWFRRDITGLVAHVVSGPASDVAGWTMIAAVIGVTAWAWRFRKGQSPCPADGSKAAMVLFAVVLTCPRFMFYDIALAVLPVLLALSDWPRLRSASRWSLLALSAGLWLVPIIAHDVWPWFWPIETICVLGLWLWSVLEVLHQNRRGLVVPTTGAAT